MTVQYEAEGAVVVITIDRPDVRNAVDQMTADALADAFRRFEADTAVAVAVLTGAGGNFCSGKDLKAIAGGMGNRINTDMEADGPMGPTRMALSKPVIAAIEGFCVAGGVEVAAWCDMRVAAQSAVFGLFNRRFGVPLVDGGSVRLPRLVGYGRAMDLILTGRELTTEEAFRIGLVDRVVDDGTSLEYAMNLARDIASYPQRAVRADRRSVLMQWGRDISYGLAAEMAAGREVVRSEEALEGAKRFVAGEGRGGTGVTDS